MTLLAVRTPTVQVGVLPHVDLLPPSEIQRREISARARSWVVIGLGAVALVLALIVGTFVMNTIANVRLADEKARTLTIADQTEALGPVSKIVNTQTELEVLRTQSMAGDIAWMPVLAGIQSQLPAGVSVAGYSLSGGPVPTPGVVGVGVIGSVTLKSTVPLTVVEATHALRSAPHVTAVETEEYASKDGIVTYRFHVEIDQTVYTGAFATKGQ